MVAAETSTQIAEPTAKPKTVAKAKAKSKTKAMKKTDSSTQSLSCTVNGKWSVMHYKLPKNAYGIREKGKSQLFQVLCRDKQPLSVRSKIIGLGIPKLEAGTDPAEVKDFLMKSVHQA